MVVLTEGTEMKGVSITMLSGEGVFANSAWL